MEVLNDEVLKIDSIFSRLNYLSKKMSDPKTTAKEMKVLKLREKKSYGNDR